MHGQTPLLNMKVRGKRKNCNVTILSHRKFGLAVGRDSFKCMEMYAGNIWLEFFKLSYLPMDRSLYAHPEKLSLLSRLILSVDKTHLTLPW